MAQGDRMRRAEVMLGLVAGLLLGAAIGVRPAAPADTAATVEVLIRALEALSVDTGRLQQSMVEAQDRIAALERRVKELEAASRRP
jgi:hypothetical protein